MAQLEKEMLQRFKKRIRSSNGNMNFLDMKDLHRLTSNQKREYIKIIKEEDDKVLQHLTKTASALRWTGDRTKSLRVKIEGSVNDWKDAAASLQDAISEKLVEAGEYQKLREFQGLEGPTSPRDGKPSMKKNERATCTQKSK